MLRVECPTVWTGFVIIPQGPLRQAVAAGRSVQYALSPVRRLAHPAEVDVSYFRQQQNRG
jgi:hypothetical protein